MNIYFAASIRGGREDEQIYRALIHELERHGTVLTEHIADPHDVEDGLSDEVIYRRDVAWLESADLVVAEVTTPSLGVGYEIAMAEGMRKPVLCLFRPSSGRTLSAMVAGSRLPVIEYETIEQALRRISDFLESTNQMGESARDG